MAHLHFVAAEPYRNRVIQLGEAPERVFVVGGLGIDAIGSLPLLDRAALAKSLDFDLGERFLLVTFHPPTAEPGEAGAQMQALLDALARLDPETRLVFTMPNADAGGREIAAQLSRFVARRANARTYESLGQMRYLSAMRHSAGVIGNSSSGLIEAPSFRVGTVNIGDRQTGRLKAASVIDCAAQPKAIEAALNQLFSPEFQAALADVTNPYGDGGAADRIVEVLRRYPLDSLLKKQFRDVELIRAKGSVARPEG
jgi:UDP-hydrolysing UDP-N-acetyl-D-glucosamine 2-epimerase